MWEKLINKTKAAIPKVAKAVGGAVESVKKAAVSVEKKVGEAIKTSAAGKLVSKGIFYFQLSAAGDALDLILQMRKAVVEEYPILTWGERRLQGIHQAVRTGIIEGGDKFGNWVYNQDILVLSGLTGGLFHASDMEGRDATVSSTVGAFLNGLLGKGVLGTADGIAGLVADPYAAIEGVNNILRRPEESVPAIWREVKKAWNDNIIEGSAEDRSRAAGATAFETLFLIGTLGGGSAAEAAQIGDKAAEVGKLAGAAEDFGKLADQASEAGRLAGNLDEITGLGKTAETAEAGKVLSSAQAGPAADYLADIISNIRKLLNPQEPQLALAMGSMDDTGEAGYFTKLYEELMKKQEVKQSSGGVRINKTAGVGDDAEAAYDALVHEGGGNPNKPKTRLPRNNGKWSGEPGNGKWFSDNPDVKKITDGKGVEFIDGKPDFSPWSKGKLKFKEGVLDGSSNDFNAVYDKIKEAKGFKLRNQAKEWLREKGLTPHHKSSTEIELIPTDLHKNVPHIGSASELRG